MTDVQQTISTPAESTALANGLSKLVLDIIAAKKGGATGAGLVTAAVTAAIADLEGALVGISGESAEIASEPVGVAEAFAIAGFSVARTLTGK